MAWKTRRSDSRKFNSASGSARMPSGKPKRTLFGPTRHPSIGKLVRIDTPTHARESVDKLNKEWDKGDRVKRVLLVQSANEAANRADVIQGNENVGKANRIEALMVREVYRDWVNKHKGKE